MFCTTALRIKTLKNLAEKNGGKIETSLSDDRLAITTGWVVNNFS